MPKILLVLKKESITFNLHIMIFRSKYSIYGWKTKVQMEDRSVDQRSIPHADRGIICKLKKYSLCR